MSPTPCEEGEEDNAHTPHINGLSLIRLVIIQLSSSDDNGIEKCTRSYFWSNIWQATAAFAKGADLSRFQQFVNGG